MSTVQEKKIIKDLGAGLILRRSTPEDAEALANFNAAIHGDNELDGTRVAAWTRDLLTRPHPTFGLDDFTIVEEAATGRILSSLNLIPQTWAYEGIPFGVGRPELVGTLPEFRGQGLIRIQFDEVHKWSLECGDLAQAVTGIPYFYRKFGYEMALDLGGRRLGFEKHVPELKDGESEPFLIHPATRADLAFVGDLYQQSQQRYPIICLRTPEIWEYELDGRSEDHVNRIEMRIITNENGERVGYLGHHPWLTGKWISAVTYELISGISWLAVAPSVVRYLWSTGLEYAKHVQKSCKAFSFSLGAEHPAYKAFAGRLPDVQEPYAWYIRVPDVIRFLRHIAPALEKRLANSIAVGHSGKLRINRYSHMLVLTFESGKLTGVEEEARQATDYGDLGLPELTLLQLIFGRSSFEELHAAFPDAYYDNDEAVILLDILFPKKHSNVLGIV